MDQRDRERQRHALTQRRQVRRRRWAAGLLLALVALIPLHSLLAGASTSPTASLPVAPRTLVITAGSKTVVVPVSAYRLARGLSQARLRTLLAKRLPEEAVTDRGRASIVFRYDLSKTARRAVTLGSGGGQLAVSRRAISAQIATPVIRQRLRNNCETAALQIALAAEGLKTDQLTLQARLTKSGTLDPIDAPNGRIWGDPDRGFVGRAEGGGVAGGFGVYPAPLQSLARRYGVAMDDLTGSSPGRIYARLLSGSPVIAWVGLSAGPYGSWTSPQGKQIKVNFGEHAVVLTAIDANGALRVHNPLQGTQDTWSQAKFEAMWQLLGRRALAA